MRFGPVPLNHALGKILGHNIAGLDGKRLLRKGKPLTTADIETLQSIGRATVYVAELTSEDVDEDTAARRVAEAVLGPGARLTGAASGRANLLAERLGVLRVDVERLIRVNDYEGLTLSTLTSNTPVQPRQMIATIKVIPFAVPEAIVQAAERVARGGGAVIRVDALEPQAVAVVFSGSASLQARLTADFKPLTDRIHALGSTITSTDYIPLEDESGEGALTRVLEATRRAGTRLVILAGETAIMDKHDLVPRAIERAGGVVEILGAPVDPGNLLMLGYLGDMPILGAPGCARSRKVNVIDWVLPRLLVGDRLTRRDILTLGHGGLLEDAPERPMPRDRI